MNLGKPGQRKVSSASLAMYIWGLSRLKRGPGNGKKMLNSEKGLISQRRREKKMTFPLVFNRLLWRI